MGSDFRDPISDEWRHDWRRNGEAIMGVTTMAAFGWVTASQTFIVAQNGRLVHPPTWGWQLWVTMVVFGAGAYIWLSSHFDRLPMWRTRQVDHSAMYTLALVSVMPQFNRPPAQPGVVEVRSYLEFKNAGPVILQMQPVHLAHTVNNQAPPRLPKDMFAVRLLPGQSKGVSILPAIGKWVEGDELYGVVEYRVRYGPVGGHPSYLRTHKVAWRAKILNGTQAQIDNWVDVEPEVDVIEAHAPSLQETKVFPPNCGSTPSS